jgi:hypothetical protein
MDGRVHTVTVVETGKGFLVRPACVVADRTDLIRFVNLTDLPCQVIVPMFSFLGDDGWSQAIRSGAASDPTRLDVGERRGAFPYQIFVFSPPEVRALAARRAFAMGESAPHIIIE